MGRAPMFGRVTATILFSWAVGRGVPAQTAPGSPTKVQQPGDKGTASAAYDVVTVRPNHEGPGSTRVSIHLDVYEATNVSLDDLLRSAYHLLPGQLEGEPKWAGEDRFDIRAKILDTPAEALKNLGPEDRGRMLRGLLADRFHLQLHTEMRTLPVLALTVAKGGARLQPVPVQNRNDAFHGIPARGMNFHDGQLVGHFLPMNRLADFLGYQVDRTVLDRTGLPGNYNVELNWTPDDQPQADDSTAASPPLFTALEQQLGLKLVATKAPVSVVVIDHVEPPTEN